MFQHTESALRIGLSKISHRGNSTVQSRGEGNCLKKANLYKMCRKEGGCIVNFLCGGMDLFLEQPIVTVCK